MAIKVYKPTSPRRSAARSARYRRSKRSAATTPERSLLRPLREQAGRNNTRRVTVRHQGGDLQAHVPGDRLPPQPARDSGMTSIEYDPNRSSRIALLTYADSREALCSAPVGLKVGSQVMSGAEAEVRVGNTLPLRNIPLGTVIHNIELEPGKGGQMARSAGVGAQLMAKEGDYAQVRLPSGEVRRVRMECLATIGQVGNTDHANINLGKAGRKRWLGIRPTVRGVAMDPNSHPHGGGEGRSPIGMPGPKTPWGKPARGLKTRQNKRTQKFIVRRRGKK